MSADVAVPDWAKGRLYQVWDYSPSHRTLLVRSPAAVVDEDNADILFSGVRRVDLATRFTLDRIVAVTERAKPPLELVRYLLSGSDAVGTVVAEHMAIERNARALFEGLGDAAAGTFEDAKTQELIVENVLTRGFPEAKLVRHASGGPDFEISIGDRRAFVEVIRSNENEPSRQVRRLVMERIPKWSHEQWQTAPLLIVVGGIDPELVVDQLKSHVATATGSNQVDALVWDDDGPDKLVDKLEVILRPRTASSGSRFEIFRDASDRFRWRLIAPNGQVLSVSEAYRTAEEATRGVGALSRAVKSASTPFDRDS